MKLTKYFAITVLVLFALMVRSAEPKMLLTDDFARFVDGTPAGWQRCGAESLGKISPITLSNGKKGIQLEPAVVKANFGLRLTFPAQAGKHYRVILTSSPKPEKRQFKAYLQLRFEPYPLKTYGNSEYLRQIPLEDQDPEDNETELTAPAPTGTTGLAVYIFATDPEGVVQLHGLTLEESDEPFAPRQPDPRKTLGALRDFHRDWRTDTVLVKDGVPAAVIVAPDTSEYQDLAAAINKAVKKKPEPHFGF